MPKSSGGGGSGGRSGGGAGSGDAGTSVSQIESIADQASLDAVKAKVEAERMAYVKSEPKDRRSPEHAAWEARGKPVYAKVLAVNDKQQELKFGGSEKARRAESERLGASIKKHQDELRAKYTPAQLNEMNSRSLASSYANDVQEGGKSFRNPSGYASNLPKYRSKKS